MATTAGSTVHSLLGRPWARSMGTKAEAAAERPPSIQDGQLLPQRSGDPQGDIAFWRVAPACSLITKEESLVVSTAGLRFVDRFITKVGL